MNAEEVEPVAIAGDVCTRDNKRLTVFLVFDLPNVGAAVGVRQAVGL